MTTLQHYAPFAAAAGHPLPGGTDEAIHYNLYGSGHVQSVQPVTSDTIQGALCAKWGPAGVRHQLFLQHTAAVKTCFARRLGTCQQLLLCALQ